MFNLSVYFLMSQFEINLPLENEESLNQSFPGQHPLTAKVFWDN